MTVSAALAQRLTELAATPRLLVALDFDGTLAPEVDDPENARALPEARAAILRLVARPDTRVALVSGRAMASLQHVAEAPDSVLLVGSHGVEFRLDSPDVTLDQSEDERKQVGRLGDVLEAVAARFDQVWVEIKPAGFALHTRLASDEDSRATHEAALAETAHIDGLTVREGKNVIEFSLRSATKGDALRHLAEFTGATAVFYAGDDVTDEDAFRVLGPADLGLKCGLGATAAGFSVANPGEVAGVLADLASLREEQAILPS
ncbi:trehalose-phosphatase [Subtercola frigoramans]|uniref:Trehalose 6-phosphate phosphatase n=1 Tax=Subtercola frigoramans TaxID=120298 RepID=A0ABS2L879_9MICO|nr:trehalose-phosphatase [Subtercola frigoramans]MBM7473229.1 trehalose 6-phosphate phosphatase [Subtercola frigoramans]